MGWSLLALLHSIPFFQFSVHGNIHESTIGTSVGRPSSVPSVALFVCSILTPSRPPSKSARPRCSAPSAGLRIGRSGRLLLRRNRRRRCRRGRGRRSRLDRYREGERTSTRHRCRTLRPSHSQSCFVQIIALGLVVGRRILMQACTL